MIWGRVVEARDVFDTAGFRGVARAILLRDCHRSDRLDCLLGAC
jgi:hypothetical protein